MVLVRRVISLDFTKKEREYELKEVEEAELNSKPTTNIHLPSDFQLWEYGKSYTTRGNRIFTAPSDPLTLRPSKNLVFTGTFRCGLRRQLESYLNRDYYYPKQNVSLGTTLIVAKTSGLGKIINALNMRIPIYSEKEFYESMLRFARENNLSATKIRQYEQLCNRTDTIDNNIMLNRYILPR